jgi:negative regulator of sigma E activity
MHAARVTTVGPTGLWPAMLADTGAAALVTLNVLRCWCAHVKGKDASPKQNPPAQEGKWYGL